MILSPLEHFELNFITYLYNGLYDFSLTSGAVYLISLLAFFYFFYFSVKKTTLPARTSNILIEDLFTFILSVFKQQISSVRALRFLPLIFSIFAFIFLLNFSSLFVYGVSLTGHILVTTYMSFSIFIGLIVIALLNFGRRFFSFFVPRGVPRALLDFIISIEIFSFIIRPFSLSIRLFANMLAGHTLMGIFSKFASYVIHHHFFFFLLPLVLVILVFTLEVAVALIQAYIFVSLVCIYINVVYKLH